MAENKKSFIAYCDWENQLELLSDEEAGKLFRHLLAYVNDKSPEFESSERILKMAFEPIRLQLKRDLDKYQEVKKKRSEAGRNGGLKSGEARSKNNQNEPNEANASFVSENEANEAVNVNDTVNVNVNDVLLEKEPKEENLSKEISVDDFSEQNSKEVNPDSGKRKKVAQKKEKYFNKDDFKKKLLDLGVDEKHANDWIQIRKDKRASFTESAIDGIVRECEKHNFPFPEAIRNCAESNWQGFKYEWIKNKNQNGQFNNQNTNNGFSNNGNASSKINGRSSPFTIEDFLTTS